MSRKIRELFSIYAFVIFVSELDFMFTDPLDMDAKKVAVWVFFGSHGGYHKYVDERNERNDCPISLIPVTTKTDWESLDNLVFRAFKVSHLVCRIFDADLGTRNRLLALACC